jgi:hypothetical protein
MKLPSKRMLFLLMLASLLSGAALAAYELNNLHRAMTAGQEIAAAVTRGLGGPTATPTNMVENVSVNLFFGLIPLGPVDHPYLVIAVGDVILGTLITGFAILLVYTLRGAFGRNPPVDKSQGESRIPQRLTKRCT